MFFYHYNIRRQCAPWDTAEGYLKLRGLAPPQAKQQRAGALVGGGGAGEVE